MYIFIYICLYCAYIYFNYNNIYMLKHIFIQIIIYILIGLCIYIYLKF